MRKINRHRVITKVEPKDNLIFHATFADGEVVSFDVRSLFDKHPVFHALEDEKLFNQISIDGVGYAVMWNDELDLSSDGIYLKGEHIDKVEPEIRVLVGQAIADIREEKKMSQRQLSASSGIMQAEICKIEQGKGNPTLSTLQKLAKSLGCTVASFLL